MIARRTIRTVVLLAVFALAPSCTDGNPTDAGMDAAVCPNAPAEQGGSCTSAQEGLRCPSGPVEGCEGGVVRPYCTCTSGTFQCEHLGCTDGG